MIISQGFRIGIWTNPIEGDSVYCASSINSIPILFINGLNVIDIKFTNNDALILSDPLHYVKIGVDSQQSINNLKTFFEVNNYNSTSVQINYSVQDIGIWQVTADFITQDPIYFDIDTIAGSRVTITSYSSVNTSTLLLKYFLEYRNIANDLYRLEIYKKNYTGLPKEVSGRVVMTKGEVKDLLEPIRGSGLDITLEANIDLDFEDLVSDNEQDFPVKLYNGNALIFQGFLKPDGIFQSFSSDLWNISVQAVDGLGFLEDLSFVNTSGSQFVGKMSMLDIIYNCLKRTGNSLYLNTYVDLYYDGMTFTPGAGNNALSLAYIDVVRFIKEDGNTFMSCKEVLEAVLLSLSAVITQINGQWFVWRPNDLYSNRVPFIKRYDLNNIYTGTYQTNVALSIGSQIDNFYPYHCNSNQTITNKGAVSAFRLGYKYGFIQSLLGNGNLNHVAGTKIYDKWTVNTWAESPSKGYLVIDPVSENGISFKASVGSELLTTAIQSTEIVNLIAEQTIEFKTRIVSYGFPVYGYFAVECGDYYLNSNGSWVLNTSSTVAFLLRNADELPNTDGSQVDITYDRSFSIKSEPVPVGGALKIIAYVPHKGYSGAFAPIVDIKSLEVINSFSGNNVVGEFHTVTRTTPPSSIVKENKNVIIGDSINSVYSGAIYMQDKIRLTQKWYRGAFADYKPLLRIVAEDELRISQKPTKLFSGDLYGNIFYMSVITINNIKGVFMPIAWSFDTFNNITSMKSLELYSPELSDIQYLKTDDYGSVITPTIV